MSAGLYSGVSGLAIGTGLYKGVSGLWSGASGLVAGWNGATLVLNFLAGAPLDSRITFTRGSNATLVDSTGKITYAPANLLRSSQDLANATWTLNAATAASNVTVAPDGTTTGGRLLASAGTGTVPRIADIAAVTVQGASQIVSIYAKADTYTYLQIYINNQAAEWANFTLSGAGTATANGSSTATITSVGNGWYRCAFRYTAGGIDRRPFFMLAASAAATRAQTWNPTGTEAIYLWGAQLEPVTYQTTPSAYQATTSSAYYGPRFDYDPVTLAAKGLLIEEQRTNSLTGPPNYNPTDATAFTKFGDAAATLTVVDDTAALATLGLSGLCTNGKVFKLDNSAGTTTAYARIINAITLGVGVNWALSCYARGTGSTIIDVNAGTWTGTTTPSLSTSYQRLVSVGSSNTSSNQWRIRATAGNVVYFIGMQAEQGEFATSIIPVGGASTVTRSADVATMTGGNFSAWYNQAEGSFVAAADSPGSGTRVIVAVDDNTANENIELYTSTLDPKFLVTDGGVAQADIDAGSITANTAFKLAAAYKANDFAASIGGGAAVADTSGTLPTVDRLRLGVDQAGNYLNGRIRSLAYYNVRLPNAQLQSLTA